MKSLPRMMAPVVIACAAIALVAPVRAEPAAGQTPAQFATAFYRAYMRLKVEGLPTANQRKVLWPMLADDIKTMIDAAQKEQDAFIKEHPDEKPPWIEGDLFSSLFEQAQTYRISAAKIDGDKAEVPVTLSHTDHGKKVQWTDTLVLAKVGDKWQVTDILFGGQWEFKTGESLRKALSATQR